MARDRRPDDLPAQNFAAMSLAEFIPAISTDLEPPYHLGEYLDLLSNLSHGKIRVCVSMPPQHAKTTTVLHAIALTLLKEPKLKFAYASYGQEFSEEQSRIVRELYLGAGGTLKPDFNRVAQWKTEMGGGLIATSWKGSLSGRRVDIMVCDDLIKDPQMAESIEDREAIWRWINGVMTQRLWPEASVVVIGSRWHFDDPSGRLIARGYRELRMPAVRVDEQGAEHALWPKVKPLEWLDTLRLQSSPDFVGTYEWEAAYQGVPAPRTGALFGPARFYDELPHGAEIVMVGIDIATSAERAADFSSAVVLAHHGGLYFVDRVIRKQESMIAVKGMLADLQRDHPPPVRMASYVSGPEKGIFNLLFHEGIAVERLPARFSKWVRAQKAAIAWKAGRILVKRGQSWTPRFVREVEFFTGDDAGRDDQVDALVSAYDAHEMSAPVGWAGGGFTFGRAVM